MNLIDQSVKIVLLLVCLILLFIITNLIQIDIYYLGIKRTLRQPISINQNTCLCGICILVAYAVLFINY